MLIHRFHDACGFDNIEEGSALSGYLDSNMSRFPQSTLHQGWQPALQEALQEGLLFTWQRVLLSVLLGGRLFVH